MHLSTISLALGLLVNGGNLVTAAPQHSSGPHLPQNARELLSQSMSWLDTFYDPSSAYLYDLSATTALRHETRSSVWYALGLLARNTHDDAHQAQRILRNAIGAQFKNASEQWYGDYQQEPEEPYVGSPAYEAEIYNTWDPNWRGFVGTTLVIIVEEYGHLLSPQVENLVVESLFNATKGDEYRVGGVDDDNLYPAYSNPSIMRAFMSAWTGHRVNDSNMTVSGEKYARDIIDLFDRNNTLSEFNSRTYTGVSLYGLTLWGQVYPRRCKTLAVCFEGRRAEEGNDAFLGNRVVQQRRILGSMGLNVYGVGSTLLWLLCHASDRKTYEALCGQSDESYGKAEEGG